MSSKTFSLLIFISSLTCDSALAASLNSGRTAEAACEKENDFYSARHDGRPPFCKKKNQITASFGPSTHYSDCASPSTHKITLIKGSGPDSPRRCIVESHDNDGNKKSTRSYFSFGEKNTELVVHHYKTKDGKYIEEMALKTASGMLNCTRPTDSNWKPLSTEYAWCGISDSVNSKNGTAYDVVKHPGAAHFADLVRGKLTVSEFFRESGGTVKPGLMAAPSRK